MRKSLALWLFLLAGIPAWAAPTISEILGRPTDHSVTVNARADAALEMYFEYGLVPSGYTAQTATVTSAVNVPIQTLIDGLRPNTRYYYRMRYRNAGSSDAYAAGTEHAFHTQRAPGSTFTFCIQGDSHPERASQFNSALYTRTLQTVAADRPDFYMTIGDDFSVDNLTTVNADTVTGRYTLQLPYLGLVAHSAPLFLVNGNHEQAARYNLDGTPNNVAVWAQNARNRYYPEPAPDGFYTGNKEEVPYIGLLRNYYAWTWGDALFVTIDPYWASPVPVDNVFSGGSKRTDMWQIGLGEAQYQWLKQTLEQSTAKWKFVFAHHVNGTGRGGTDIADLYEWGGKNDKGVWEFDSKRPGWALPIHQLMAANHVTIFFQGHDHLFVRQQLDGVTYQELPEPGDPSYTLWNADAYKSGDRFSNTGYLRVTVSPSSVFVAYVRTFMPQDEKVATEFNGMVQFQYAIPAGGTVNGASFRAPVTAGSIASVFGANLAPASAAADRLPLPTTLGGVSVSMNGFGAPLLFVSPQQINLQVPWQLQGLPQASMTVSVNGAASAPQSFSLAGANPGLFAIDSGGRGAVLIASTGELAAAGGSVPGRSARPVNRGEYLSIFCTGLGLVVNPPIDGTPASSNPLSTTIASPTVTIGGVPAPVSFSGLSPGFVGLYQVDVQVPSNAAAGNAVPVVLAIDGVPSNTVTIAVQ